jgi:hypothetical protein
MNMRIEVRLQVDNEKQKLYWSGRLRNDDQVLFEVVSMYFNRNDSQQVVQGNYERTFVRVWKEIFKRSDSEKLLKAML